MADSGNPHTTVFLSAATVDLRKWRRTLYGAFSRAGFRVLTQRKSLRSATGNVKSLLSESIDEADCIIHLAGMGYGSDADGPFPDYPSFQCSWTQFEYYYAHAKGKKVIAFVCGPSLSASGFTEKGSPDVCARKRESQQQHRERVRSGRFDGTPLEGKVGRTSNEEVDSVSGLLNAVAAAVGTLHMMDRERCIEVQQTLRHSAEELANIQSNLSSINQGMGSLREELSTFKAGLLQRFDNYDARVSSNEEHNRPREGTRSLTVAEGLAREVQALRKRYEKVAKSSARTLIRDLEACLEKSRQLADGDGDFEAFRDGSSLREEIYPLIEPLLRDFCRVASDFELKSKSSERIAEQGN